MAARKLDCFAKMTPEVAGFTLVEGALKLASNDEPTLCDNTMTFNSNHTRDSRRASVSIYSGRFVSNEWLKLLFGKGC